MWKKSLPESKLLAMEDHLKNRCEKRFGFDEGEASIRFTEGRRTSFIQKPYSPEELTAALWDTLPADQGE